MRIPNAPLLSVLRTKNHFVLFNRFPNDSIHDVTIADKWRMSIEMKTINRPEMNYINGRVTLKNVALPILCN